MNFKSPFKWHYFPPDIIFWGVRWYCLYPISYRQIEEMMCDRGVEVDHTTLSRWVHTYALELDKWCRLHLKSTTDSWRVDENYIKVKGKDKIPQKGYNVSTQIRTAVV